MLVQDLDAREEGQTVTMTTGRLGLGILNDAGRVVYVVKLLSNGSLHVECGDSVPAGEKWLAMSLCIVPKGFDRVSLFRPVEDDCRVPIRALLGGED